MTAPGPKFDFAALAARVSKLDPMASISDVYLRAPGQADSHVLAIVHFRDRVALSLFIDEMLTVVGTDRGPVSVGRRSGRRVGVEVRR